MKTYMHKLANTAGWSLAIAGVLVLTQFHAIGAETEAGGTGYSVVTVSEDGKTGAMALGGGTPGNSIVIRSIEPFSAGERQERKEVTWLGASVEEAPEVLTAQLGLDPGVGLVVTYVATNSPAAKAGLQKNDLLVEFDGQSLVHPMQLRKLVQVRREGDAVKLMFCRAGKKQTVSATLAKTVTSSGFPYEFPAAGGLLRPFVDRTATDACRKQMEDMDLNQEQVQKEIRHSMEEARRTYEQALRQATNANSTLGPILEDLASRGASVDSDASVLVRSTSRSAKCLVKADESGTITLVKNPKLHLTAHDKDGKLLFDGEIETSHQRDKVPRDLWNKVEPLLKKMTSDGEEQPDTKRVPPEEPPSLPDNGSSS